LVSASPYYKIPSELFGSSSKKEQIRMRLTRPCEADIQASKQIASR
jgi:hypothetical protein